MVPFRNIFLNGKIIDMEWFQELSGQVGKGGGEEGADKDYKRTM